MHDSLKPARPFSFSRRRLIGVTSAAAAFGIRSRYLAAQEADDASTPESVPIESTTTGEMPSSGALRPGPVGEQPALPQAVNASDPVQISIDTIGVNADVEATDIENGVMTNPTGPWVVAWYRQTASLGEQGNVVLAGHVDYWDVGPSVFFDVRNLVAGDIVTLVAEDGRAYDYAVDWSETYDIAALTSGTLQDVVSATDVPSVTLITCGGEFDYVNGEYLSRMVVRGTLSEIRGTPAASTPEA